MDDEIKNLVYAKIKRLYILHVSTYPCGMVLSEQVVPDCAV